MPQSRFLMALTILLPLSCKTPSSNTRQSESDKHTEGEFTNDANPAGWAPEPLNLYQKSVEPFAVVDSNTNIAKRMQFWADTIRDNMQKSWKKVADIPKPNIRIVASSEINAYVQPVYYKAKIPIEFLNSHPKRDCLFTGYDCALITNESEFSDLSLEKPETLFNRFKFSNQGTFEGCEPSIVSNTIKLKSTCSKTIPEDLSGHYSGFVGSATSTEVTFFQGLLNIISEEEAIFVLAHELGHYYRNHLFSRNAKYQYFYRRDLKYTSGKPQPAPELEELGQQISDSNLPKSAPLKGLGINPDLYIMGISNLSAKGSCVAGKDCQKACKEYLETTQARIQTYKSKLKRQRFECSDAKDYAAEFLQFKSCADTQLANNDLFRQDMEIRGYKDADFRKIPLASKTISLYEYLLVINQAFEQALDRGIEKNNKLIKQGLSEQIGWYTEEQEADEIAGEIAVRLKLGTMVGAKVPMALLKATDPEQFNKCNEAFKNGFKDPIAPGNFQDIHHDSCFRAYNYFWQEKIRGSAMAKDAELVRPKVPLNSSWQADLEELNKLHPIAAPQNPSACRR